MLKSTSRGQGGRPGAAVKVRIGDRALTPEELLARALDNPKQVSKIAHDGFKIEAEPRVLDWLHTTALGPYVGDDGEVTSSAAMGWDDALVIAVLVTAFAASIGGYTMGYDEGYEAGAAAASNGDTNGDETDDNGNGEQNGGEDN